MKRWIALLALSGVFLWEVSAQNARLVSLDVQVIDSRTGEIPDLLGPHDFRIYDDGRPAAIQNLAVETPPLDLVFVVYLSNPGLSTLEDRQRFGKGLNAAGMSLRRDDHAAVVRGSGPRGELLALTGNIAAIRQALLRGPQAQPDKGRLFDAVSTGLSLLSGQTPPTRRAVLSLRSPTT